MVFCERVSIFKRSKVWSKEQNSNNSEPIAKVFIMKRFTVKFSNTMSDYYYFKKYKKGLNSILGVQGPNQEFLK